jgi:hypothetical protein
LHRRLPFVFLLALAVTLGAAAGAQAHRDAALADGPTVNGAPQIGATLSADVGPLRCQPNCSYTIEWLSCAGGSPGGGYHPIDTPLPNERAPGCDIAWASPAPATYTLSRLDQGRYIQFHVLVADIECDEEGSCSTTEVRNEAYSPTVGPVAATSAPPEQPPANTVAPTISGTAEDGQTLRVSDGEWTGTFPILFVYKWLRCPGARETCTAIAGERENTYALRAADVGARIAVTVTAANRLGRTSVTAGPTARVAAARPRPGRDTRKIQDVRPPDRLLVKSIEGPRVVRSRSGVLLRVTVTDRRGFLIDGATVTASGARGAVVPVRRKTGTRGVAFLVVALSPRAVAPSRIALVITASKPGVRSVTARARVVLRVVAL